MNKKTIYLIRHAQPDFPGGKALCLGQKVDLPLSPEGRAQADALARFFSQLPLEAVYASPLLRAKQTAQAIASERIALVTLDHLTELDGGEWDGLTFEEIRARYRHRRSSPPPGGETDEAGLARALAALEWIDQHTQRCAAVVAHGAIIRLLLCHLSGRPLSEKKEFALKHAQLRAIERTENGWTIAES